MATTPKKSFALDIFEVLRKLSTGDTQLYDSLTDEERKSISPLVVMRWMSGTSDMRQIVMLNEFVNPFVFSIGGNHKELLVKLLAVASSKQPHRYKWVPIKKKEGKESALSIKVLMEAYEYSAREVREIIRHVSPAEIYEIAEQLGWQSDELKKLKKEISLK